MANRQNIGNRTPAAALLTAVLVLGGCASSPLPADPARSARSVEYGTVRTVEVVEGRRDGIGAGTVIGGVVGGVLGNQVGSGDGRKAATVAGAIGGAVVGHQIEKGRNAGDTVQYTVSMDNGDQRSFTYPTDQGVRVGQRVRIVDGLLQPW